MTDTFDQSNLQPTVEDKSQRTMGMLCHLLALAGFVGVPFGNIIGPLILWLIKKEEMPFVDDQGKESLNFQITMILISLFCFVLIFIGIGVILLIALGIFDLIMIVIATVKANSGIAYRYPFAIRLLK